MLQWIPSEGVEIILTLFLSFLIGLEREEQHLRTHAYHFGGIRTYPLLGLIGLLLTKLFPDKPVAVLVGLVVLAPFLVISYYYKLTREQGGFTSEMAGVITYLSGALIGHQMYWLAATVVILNVLLLQAKEGLEKLGTIIAPAEINTFLRFLILTAVLLPIVPNQAFTQFHINPFQTWLVVIAVCGISYGSYLLQLLFRSRDSVFLSALLGGIYSSTVTTVVMAKRAKQDPGNPVYPYAIVGASSLMYVRSAIWLALFNDQLFRRIGWPFLCLALAGILASYVCVKWKGKVVGSPVKLETLQSNNPLEFSTAFIFAALFIGILIATHVAAERFGFIGTYAVAGLAGFVNPDPFVIGLAQSSASWANVNVAFAAIAVTTASNNLIKGIYAIIFGDRRTGLLSLLYLTLLTAASLLVLAGNW